MKVRLISAIVMLALFIPLLMLGGLAYAILMAVLSVISLWELLRIRAVQKKFPPFLMLLSYILVIFLTLNNYKDVTFMYTMDYKMMASMLFIYLIPMVFINNNKRYGLDDALFMTASTLFIGISFSLLILLRNFSLDYVIFIFIITVITDTFAYITGKNIGKHKLAPKISPKKTIEGTIGGTLMGTFMATMFYVTVINPAVNIFVILFITTILSLIGQIGDLVFSSIKREYERKDFSNIIPGHGGILDRLDSIIFVVLGLLLFLTII